MEMDCNYYFLTGTALEIWRNGDKEGENRMWKCLYERREEHFFPRVIYRNGRVAVERITELAETAFHTAWEAFTNDGRAGKNRTSDRQYTAYFFGIFRFKFLKLLAQEQVRRTAEEEFHQRGTGGDAPGFEIKPGGLYSPRVQKVLDAISPDCRQLLTWRYVDGLSHDLIAEKKKIERESSIKMVHRCKQRFLKAWSDIPEHLN